MIFCTLRFIGIGVVTWKHTRRAWIGGASLEPLETVTVFVYQMMTSEIQNKTWMEDDENPV